MTKNTNLERQLEFDFMKNNKHPTNWPITLSYYLALPLYLYYGSQTLTNMTGSESRFQEAMIPLAFGGMIAGVFALRNGFSILSDFTKNYFS